MLKEALSLLHQEDIWNGMEIRYEYPNVDRIWTKINGGKLCLHHLYPIPNGEVPYYHPHPWSMSAVILSGSYYMNLGYSESEASLAAKEAPPVAIRLYLTAGSSYVIDNKFAWHTVEPVTDVFSIVKLTQKWKRKIPPRCERLQHRLSTKRQNRLREIFLELLDRQAIAVA